MRTLLAQQSVNVRCPIPENTSLPLPLLAIDSTDYKLAQIKDETMRGNKFSVHMLISEFSHSLRLDSYEQLSTKTHSIQPVFEAKDLFALYKI